MLTRTLAKVVEDLTQNFRTAISALGDCLKNPLHIIQRATRLGVLKKEGMIIDLFE